VHRRRAARHESVDIGDADQQANGAVGQPFGDFDLVEVA
jgi:hypothetical protein